MQKWIGFGLAILALYAKRRRLYDDDFAKAMAEMYLPNALARTYPNAANE